MRRNGLTRATWIRGQRMQKVKSSSTKTSPRTRRQMGRLIPLVKTKRKWKQRHDRGKIHIHTQHRSRAESTRKFANRGQSNLLILAIPEANSGSWAMKGRYVQIHIHSIKEQLLITTLLMRTMWSLITGSRIRKILKEVWQMEGRCCPPWKLIKQNSTIQWVYLTTTKSCSSERKLLRKTNNRAKQLLHFRTDKFYHLSRNITDNRT